MHNIHHPAGGGKCTHGAAPLRRAIDLQAFKINPEREIRAIEPWGRLGMGHAIEVTACTNENNPEEFNYLKAVHAIALRAANLTEWEFRNGLKSKETFEVLASIDVCQLVPEQPYSIEFIKKQLFKPSLSASAAKGLVNAFFRAKGTVESIHSVVQELVHEGGKNVQGVQKTLKDEISARAKGMFYDFLGAQGNEPQLLKDVLVMAENEFNGLLSRLISHNGHWFRNQ